MRGHFGLALCLGNTLPHLLSPESVSRMLVGLKRRLLPGARCLFHLLDYDRVFAGERTLPVELLNLDGVDHLVVRLLEPREDGIVLHTTTLLRYTPTEEPILQVVDVRRLQLRGWRLGELEAMLDVARLPIREILGGMTGADYEPGRSSELVLVAG